MIQNAKRDNEWWWSLFFNRFRLAPAPFQIYHTIPKVMWINQQLTHILELWFFWINSLSVFTNGKVGNSLMMMMSTSKNTNISDSFFIRRLLIRACKKKRQDNQRGLVSLAFKFCLWQIWNSNIILSHYFFWS